MPTIHAMHRHSQNYHRRRRRSGICETKGKEKKRKKSQYDPFLYRNALYLKKRNMRMQQIEVRKE
jgi:hypothetical protein